MVYHTVCPSMECPAVVFHPCIRYTYPFIWTPIAAFSQWTKNLLYFEAEFEFLDEIQTKVLRVFLLAIHSHRYSFALRYLFLQIHATSYSSYSLLLYMVKEIEGKPDRKTIPPSLWFEKNTSRNLKSLRTLKIMSRNLSESVRSWVIFFTFLYCPCVSYSRASFVRFRYYRSGDI